MADERDFTVAGIRPQEASPPPPRPPWYRGRPVLAWAVLAVLVLGCLSWELWLPGDPGRIDLGRASSPPGEGLWFGADLLGRDIFAMIWAGGRTSLAVGFAAGALSAALGLVLGALGGLAPRGAGAALSRCVEIFLSVPQLLAVMLLLGALDRTGAPALTLALALGLTSWPGLARVAAQETRRLRASGYVEASRTMGGGFFHILRRHLAPGCFPAVMFMAVMNVRSAIAAEAALSFLGLGLPVEAVSWGSMLALSERALLGGGWWMIVIPGAFLTGTLLCLTEIGNSFRRG